METKMLQPEQRQYLEEMAGQAVDERLLRRARILLLYDGGEPTRAIAETLSLSRGRVRYWRRQYQKLGLAIFTAPARPALLHPPSPSFSQKREQEEGQEQSSPGSPLPELREGGSEERSYGVMAGETANHESVPVRDGPPPTLLDLLGESLKTPGVTPDDPIAEAGRKVMRHQFAQVLQNEAGTREGSDIEFLHDMRVATRRLRAAFEVFQDAFKPEALKKQLKGLRATGRTLGRVRDLDVFLEKARRYQATLPEEQRAGLEPLLEAWSQQREAGRVEMLAYLDGEAYHNFLRRFFAFVSTPGSGAILPPPGQPVIDRVRDRVPALIYNRLASVRAFDPILPTATIEQFHALRIEFKKLRYTVEFFREVLGPEAKEVITHIKLLQDHLGDLNDAQVATLLLRDFLTEWDLRQAGAPVADRQGPDALMAYLSYQYAERQRLMLTFQAVWAEFNQPEFRRNLALAVSVL